jgi:hypothetical protein
MAPLASLAGAELVLRYFSVERLNRCKPLEAPPPPSISKMFSIACLDPIAHKEHQSLVSPTIHKKNHTPALNSPNAGV